MLDSDSLRNDKGRVVCEETVNEWNFLWKAMEKLEETGGGGAHKAFSSRDIAEREQQVLFGRLRAGFRWTQDDKLIKKWVLKEVWAKEFRIYFAFCFAKTLSGFKVSACWMACCAPAASPFLRRAMASQTKVSSDLGSS